MHRSLPRLLVKWALVPHSRLLFGKFWIKILLYKNRYFLVLKALPFGLILLIMSSILFSFLIFGDSVCCVKMEPNSEKSEISSKVNVKVLYNIFLQQFIKMQPNVIDWIKANGNFFSLPMIAKKIAKLKPLRRKQSLCTGRPRHCLHNFLSSSRSRTLSPLLTFAVFVSFLIKNIHTHTHFSSCKLKTVFYFINLLVQKVQQKLRTLWG